MVFDVETRGLMPWVGPLSLSYTTILPENFFFGWVRTKVSWRLYCAEVFRQPLARLPVWIISNQWQLYPQYTLWTKPPKHNPRVYPMCSKWSQISLFRRRGGLSYTLSLPGASLWKQRPVTPHPPPLTSQRRDVIKSYGEMEFDQEMWAWSFA